MKLEPLLARTRRLFLQLEFSVLVWGQERNDDVKTGSPPRPHLVPEPVAAARPRDKSETAGPGAWNAIDLDLRSRKTRFGDAHSRCSRGNASMSTSRSRSTWMR